MNGHKRHLLVDTEGLVIRVAVLAASIQDRDGARDLLDLAAPVCPRLKHIWADAAYAGALVAWTRQPHGWTLAIVRRTDDVAGLVVQPRRRVVERTFAWLGTNRRLAKDYEEYGETTETWVYLAMVRLMLRRLTHQE